MARAHLRTTDADSRAHRPMGTTKPIRRRAAGRAYGPSARRWPAGAKRARRRPARAGSAARWEWRCPATEGTICSIGAARDARASAPLCQWGGGARGQAGRLWLAKSGAHAARALICGPPNSGAFSPTAQSVVLVRAGNVLSTARPGPAEATPAEHGSEPGGVLPLRAALNTERTASYSPPLPANNWA